MKAFLVGGAGFIGSHCLARLLADDSALVTVYDNFCTGRPWHVESFQNDPRVKIVRGDAKDLESLCRAMRDHDTVFHFAANADIAKAISDPTVDFWEGTYLTQNVLEAMRSTETRRIVYMSGSGVYGDVGTLPVVEDCLRTLPVSPYGASKLASESLISAYSQLFGVEAVIYRFANVVGPRQTHGVGYDFIRRLLVNPRRLEILGDGNQSKSYLYVDDVIDAITIFNGRPVRGVDVYNVATEDYVSVTEIAQLAVAILNLESVEFVYSGGSRGWKGDVPTIRFDSSKLRGAGWRNRHTSREALQRSMESILADARQGRFDQDGQHVPATAFVPPHGGQG
jgi:UDP-glucose 4-epimerase